MNRFTPDRGILGRDPETPLDCPRCQHENPDGNRFCGGCGAALAAGCPACGHENPPGNRFCGACGAGLEAAPALAPAAPERVPLDYTPKHLADRILRSKSALEGERKQVSVLFADVKGSMELAGETDPEQWHGILDRFLGILADGIHRFEGTVNQYTGDGIMALFGAPIAHEDHAQRACYAALHLLDELREFARDVRRRHGLEFAVRIGVNSGEVVVGKIGDDLRMDYTAAGQTVGLAQRMEALAEPNTCAVSESTKALVAGYFDLEDLGVFSVKGVAEPIPVFALRGLGAARTRLERSRSRGFSKFVGRGRELESLEGSLEEAIAGSGQVVGVVAEAGTGKSRLCLEFVEQCRARGIRVNEAHCPAHGKTIPYLPLLEMMRSIFDIRDGDSEREARRKIAGELLLLDDKFQELLPLLFDFLGVPDPDRPAPDMTPDGRQQQLIGFVRDLARARSRHEPAVLLLDDLHWIDPGSDAFLAHSVDAAEGTRTLWLVNFRPEYHAEWMKKSTYRQLPLRPLGREEIEELLEALLGADPSVLALPDRIHERTGGNPFFVEEVVQSLVESGNLEGAPGAYRLVTPPEALEIPGTVRSVLAARIDRLEEREKRLLQTASVIEKEFSEPVLRRVAGLEKDELAGSLARLVQGEFLLETALFPVAEFAFKHPLTQEVAYQSQLGERRAALHARVAEALEEIDADKLDERAGLLAYHWEAAGEPLVAARWHARAARGAGFDSPSEAKRHWEKVWELVPRPAESDEATALLRAAAPEFLKLGFRQGGVGPEREAEILAEGRELALRSSDSRALVAMLYGHGVANMLRGTPQHSMAPYLEGIQVADAEGDDELRWAAREPLWFAYATVGDLDAALGVSDEAIEIAQAMPLSRGTVTGFSSAWLWGSRGWIQADRGRFAEAIDAHRRCEEGHQRLQETEQLAWNDGFRARTLERMGDADGALRAFQRGDERAEKIGSVLAHAVLREQQGAALVLQGEWEAARERLLETLSHCREHRVWLSSEPEMLSSLAQAHLGLGEGDLARRAVDEALEIARGREAVLGELRALLAQVRVLLGLEGGDARAQVEAALARALEIATATGARSYLPLIGEQRGRLASALGDDAACARELEAAVALCRELGATGHAERIEKG